MNCNPLPLDNAMLCREIPSVGAISLPPKRQHSSDGNCDTFQSTPLASGIGRTLVETKSFGN
jgi:hypothetical protein